MLFVIHLADSTSLLTIVVDLLIWTICRIISTVAGHIFTITHNSRAVIIWAIVAWAVVTSTGFLAGRLDFSIRGTGAGIVSTVGISVIASVGASWSHTITKSTGFLAFRSNIILVAIGFSKSCTVRVIVSTGLSSCQRGISSTWSSFGADRNRIFSTNTTHFDTTLQLDVSTFSPTSSPTVLDKPVVHSTLSTITNNCDSMISGWASASGKNSTWVVREISFSLNISSFKIYNWSIFFA